MNKTHTYASLYSCQSKADKNRPAWQLFDQHWRGPSNPHFWDTRFTAYSLTRSDQIWYDETPRWGPFLVSTLTLSLVTDGNWVKVKEADLYSAFIKVPYTQGAQVQITQCYLQTTPYLLLPRKHSPDGASQIECGLVVKRNIVVCVCMCVC